MCPFKKTRKEKNRKIQCDKRYLNPGSSSASNAGRFYLSSRGITRKAYQPIVQIVKLPFKVPKVQHLIICQKFFLENHIFPVFFNKTP